MRFDVLLNPEAWNPDAALSPPTEKRTYSPHFFCSLTPQRKSAVFTSLDKEIINFAQLLHPTRPTAILLWAILISSALSHSSVFFISRPHSVGNMSLSIRALSIPISLIYADSSVILSFSLVASNNRNHPFRNRNMWGNTNGIPYRFITQQRNLEQSNDIWIMFILSRYHVPSRYVWSISVWGIVKPGKLESGLEKDGETTRNKHSGNIAVLSLHLRSLTVTAR